MASSSSTQPLGNPPAEKLTRANFLLWKTQAIPALRGARLLDILTGKEKAPPEYVVTEKDGKKANPAYDAWLERDQRVLTYLVNSLSTDILAQTVGLEHVADVWDRISTTLASRSKASIATLRGALTNTKKESKTADQYIAMMRGFAQELMAAGKPVDEDELVTYIVNGLDEDYNSVAASVNVMESCTVSELHWLISAFEIR